MDSRKRKSELVKDVEKWRKATFCHINNIAELKEEISAKDLEIDELNEKLKNESFRQYINTYIYLFVVYVMFLIVWIISFSS